MKKNYLNPLLILMAAFFGGSCNDAGSVHETTDQSSLARVSPPSPSAIPITTPDRSKYESENIGFYGLYYLAGKNDSDLRKLIISEDDKPIPQKSNDPDEATNPGFYVTDEKRLDFEEIEIIGKRLYFKTRESDGIHYEFHGVFGEKIDPNFSDDVPIPFIKGALNEFKNDEVVKTENVEFGHAVIA